VFSSSTQYKLGHLFHQAYSFLHDGLQVA